MGYERHMRCASLLPLLLACGSTPRPVEAAPPVRVELSEDDLPAGTCAGFATLGQSEPVSLLAGRLRVRGPAGIGDIPRSHSIMAAPPAAEMESRLLLEHEGARFVVFAEELFRTPSDDLLAAARADAGEGYRVSALTVEEPLRAVIAIPRELDTSDEAVDVALVYTVTPDDLVQRVGFYVTPDAAEDGGCERLALALAGTLHAGGRSLPDEPGPRVLEGTLGIDLPPRHRLVVEEGPDFSVYRVYALLPLGGGEGSLGIYIGGHPSMRRREGATRSRGRIGRRPVEWEDSTEEGARFRQGLVELGPHRYAHVFFSSDDPEAFERLREVAVSLREGVTPPPLAACPDASELPAVEVDAEVLRIPALATLLRAEEFSSYRRTWDVARVESAEAFFALAEHPRARDAFLYLAVHGTTAGRLYGLSGLYLWDRDRFDSIACAVASTLEAEVVVRRACGTERVRTAALIERPAGARGQRHFTAQQWRELLARSAADVRGGGLAWQLALGPSDSRTIEESGWEIGGTGYLPPLDPSDRAAAAMPAWAPGPHEVRMAITQAGGVCRTRSDGRVACWGSTPASELSGARLLPDWVRWPREIGVDLGLGCVLDASGQRSCFALIDRALEARRAACPNALAPAEVVMRRFDDGPWRALAVANDLCGIRMDGTVRCFRNSARYTPAWAELEGIGLGAWYTVPIGAEVRGVAPGYLGSAIAWTADGTIWSWSTYDAPRVVGQVEGVTEATGGNDGEWIFARTGDGRVFVRGVRRGAQYWGSFPDEEGPFVEIPELRGQRVWMGDHHGCVLNAGAVRCWGQHAGYRPGAEDGDDRAPEDVPALRGARSLWLGEWITCADMPNGSWRCVGNHLDGITNGAVPESRHAPYDLRLDRIASSIR